MNERRRPDGRIEKSRKEKVVSLLIGLLFAIALFVAAELLVRVLYSAPPAPYPIHATPPAGEELYEYDPELWWLPRPNVVAEGGQVRTNSLGLRGGEFPRETSNPKTFRVLVLGDSPTWGFGVGNDETYAHELEELLNRARPDVAADVLNAGICAYSTVQSLRLERRLLEAFQFDLVVIANMGSDRRRGHMADEAWNTSEFERILMGLAAKSALVGFVRDKTVGRGGGKQSLSSKGTSRVPAARYRDNLASMVAAAREKGGEALLLVSLPLAQFDHDPVPPEEWRIEPTYREAMRLAAERTGAALCDLPALVAGLSDTSWVYLDATHPTPRGHRWIAEALLPDVLKVLEAKFPAK